MLLVSPNPMMCLFVPAMCQDRDLFEWRGIVCFKMSEVVRQTGNAINQMANRFVLAVISQAFNIGH